MLSIFKAVRDNNVDTVRDLVQLASAGTTSIISTTTPPASVNSTTAANINNYHDYQHSPQQQPQQQQHHYRQLLQRYTKATGQRQFNLNKRSIRGRTALHCAATWNRTEIAKILIACPLVNINIQDRENGWTALHRSLYLGNLEIALFLLQRGDADLNIKDWEGIRPLELMSITLHNFPVPKSIDLEKDDKFNNDDDEDTAGLKDVVGSSKKMIGSGGTDLYSWGSNTNYLLGHRDSENRTYPEHVHLELESQRTGQIMQRTTVLMESVKMSKNHMAVLTSEKKHNLLLCGFGRGGRLGTGSEADAQLVPKPVQWPERIMAVALGRDHTVAVSVRGSVITFGSNEYGQLGYETEDMQQLVPRKIQAPSLKRQEIVGAAASTVHSVVFTQTDLFTFGYNRGQLGYHAAGDDIRQSTPRKIALNNRIKQVVAMEYATAVLLESKEVLLLCNHTQQKVIFPTNRFPVNMQVYTSASHYMVKLLQSGDEYLGAISNLGEIYLWTCRPSSSKQADKGKSSSSSSQKQSAIVSSPKRVWDLKKPHLAAVDASLGHHGELIVCTVSGQVFVGSPTKDGYKYRIIPKLQRCIQVCASPSNAFAAIRSEVTPKKMFGERSTFADDLASSLPHVMVSDQLERDVKRLEREKGADLELLYHKTQVMDNGPDAEDVVVQEKAIVRDYKERLKDTVTKAWDRAVVIGSEDNTADVVFVSETHSPMFCHSSILISRSPLFKRLFKDKGKVIQSDHIKIIWTSSQKRVEIRIRQPISAAAMLLFCDYIYTDTYIHPMNAYYKQPNLSINNNNKAIIPTATMVQKDLIMLATLFDMEILLDSASLAYGNTPRPSLKMDMLRLLDEQHGCDVVLDLKDGHSVLCHEVVLRQRCPFFEALFEPRSVWMEARREQISSEDPLVHVQMTHISKDLMRPLLQYLYADMDENELFGGLYKETPEEMMHYLIDVLRIADELLLTRLKRSCERALVRFLKLRTASHLLESADLYLANWLKDACLDFIAANLDIFLTSGMLEGIEPQVIQELERHVRYCQAYQLPSVRNVMLSSPAPITGEEDTDEEFGSSLYTLSREETPIVSSYYETLVTVLPETPASPLTPRSEEGEGVFAMDEDQHKVDKKKSSSKYLPPESKNSRRQQQGTHNITTATTTSWQGWAPTPAMSLGSLESKVSLREVLDQHPKPSELSSTPPPSFGKPSPPHVSKKLSQKERRKLQQQELAAAAAAATPKPVWGKVANVPAPSPAEMGRPGPESSSLAKESANAGTSTSGTGATTTISSPSSGTSSNIDTKRTAKNILDQGSSSTGVLDDGSKGKKIYISKDELDLTLSDPRRRSSEDSGQEDDLFKPERSLGAGFSFTPIRRSKYASMTRQHSQEEQQFARSFQSIQKQQEQEDLWIKGKQARKNLTRIQAEERAVDGLQQFYIQTLDAKSGEWFEVNRLETR
ncbi:hypothetical protein BDB00DRAFT_952741 [Zychaea mexicana]|uniref:uncharacterized protein n=1 Tax=Zychaea mexicana TaxID=64656 RepID=UPI0022FE4DFC|nr:uncharacterized protein BDB00DRAFT_952741 [Zychaea mexicana]KAI9496700.1 hypothetical protein BDB00DRAFT_952741 [Zychaea mexicana]